MSSLKDKIIYTELYEEYCKECNFIKFNEIKGINEELEFDSYSGWIVCPNCLNIWECNEKIIGQKPNLFNYGDVKEAVQDLNDFRFYHEMYLSESSIVSIRQVSEKEEYFKEKYNLSVKEDSFDKAIELILGDF